LSWYLDQETAKGSFGGGGATRPLPRDGGVEELHGDPTVGPCPKVWTEVRDLFGLRVKLPPVTTCLNA